MGRRREAVRPAPALSSSSRAHPEPAARRAHNPAARPVVNPAPPAIRGMARAPAIRARAVSLEPEPAANPALEPVVSLVPEPAEPVRRARARPVSPGAKVDPAPYRPTKQPKAIKCSRAVCDG